jgi:hypothetical protein
MFWDQDAMTMHAALVAECLDDFATGIPRVLLGDFNVKPEDPGYHMLTTGNLAADVHMRIQQRMFPGWQLQLQAPLASAYCLAHGESGAAGEPAYAPHDGFLTPSLFLVPPCLVPPCLVPLCLVPSSLLRSVSSGRVFYGQVHQPHVQPQPGVHGRLGLHFRVSALASARRHGHAAAH